MQIFIHVSRASHKNICDANNSGTGQQLQIQTHLKGKLTLLLFNHLIDLP